MKRSHWILLGIILGSLMLRLLLLPLIHNPGLNDQNHYYNLGQRLHRGLGFTIDYVWQFSHVPENMVHPIDHWMPLSGIAVMLGMNIAGENIHAALIFFLIAGSLIPLLTYIAARQYKLDITSALIAAAFAAVLPDFVWNSLRTDTTSLNMVFITGSILLLNHSLQKGRSFTLLGSGFLAGLAYLNRNDSIIILPTVWLVLIAYGIFAKQYISRVHLFRAALLIPLAFILTVLPWLIRNQNELGMLTTAETSRMFFMVDQRDHYAYDTDITFETMLERQSLGQLIGKRVFELLAAFKQIIISLDIILPILIPLGLFYLLWKRDVSYLLLISPALIWLLGILFAYPILIPLKSQSGSFEKSYLTIVPLLIPIGSLVLKRAITDKNWQIAIAFTAVCLMAANSFDLVRQETQFADSYYSKISQFVETLEILPDINGDNEIRIMTQDPYVMSYYGYKSIMIPFATREQTLYLAQHYNIDYLMMPAARPALDPLFMQNEIDHRFVFSGNSVLEVGRSFELYALYPDRLND